MTAATKLRSKDTERVREVKNTDQTGHESSVRTADQALPATKEEENTLHLPMLQPGRSLAQSQDLFFGLNHNLRLRPGEFYDMKNLTGDLFPVLSTRKPRSIVKTGTRIQGMADKGGLCYVEGTALYLNGRKLDLNLSEAPGDCPKQLVSMGAYLIILPDRKYVNTANPGDYGNIDAEVTTAAPVSLCLCTLDGTEIRPEFTGRDTPQEPGDHSYWLDMESGILQQYSKSTDLWIVIETPYVKLQCPGIGKGFRPYDGVQISGDPELQDLMGAAILYGCGEDYLIVPGLLAEAKTIHRAVTVSRKMPEMDFVVESQNRLWGCRYGPNSQGKVVNELYCSKLGDFRNWNCFLGVSTDSYIASLGSDGPFTGAISQGGYPLFFKEKCLHKVFGTMPSNFQVQTTACRGVEPGSQQSLAIVGEVVYYKSRDGICAYDGSLPRLVSEALGKEAYHSAVGAGIRGKYYVSMEKEDHTPELLVYDTEKNLWHKEDGLRARILCPCREELFCVDSTGRLLGLLGTTGEQESSLIPWMVQSGIIGISLPGSKYLSRISFRMLLEPGSRVSVSVQYDSQGLWETVGTVQGMSLRSFVFPVVPRRCDHLRLRLEGQGKAILYSVTKTLKPGSEVSL